MKVFVIIPALNEARTIDSVVRGVAPYAHTVIVVDDGSRDKTASRAESAGAVVLRHERGAGYDAALNDGFREAAARGADIFITFDADGEHDPAYLPHFISPIEHGEADLVIGERPRSRHVAENIFMLYTWLRFGIRDPLCGLKAYHRRVYDAIGHFDTVQSIGTQLTVEALRKGFRLATIPVKLRPRADESRFYWRRIRANLRMLKAMVRVMRY